MTQTVHSSLLSIGLDVADKVIKLFAVVIGGLWAWWNFHKSRPYRQKLELEVSGSVFLRASLYGDAKVTVKNIGGTSHLLQQAGTYCRLSEIHSDLSEQQIRVFNVFGDNDSLEPGETMTDAISWRITPPIDDLVWIRLDLRVVSKGVEWNASTLIRIEDFEKHKALAPK